MPIVRINEQRIAVHCPFCKAVRELKMTDLVLGVPPNPDCIVLPPCACGAGESLFRTWHKDPATPPAAHRRAVNALCSLLKAAGRTHENHAVLYAKERNPADTLEIDGDVEVLVAAAPSG